MLLFQANKSEIVFMIFPPGTCSRSLLPLLPPRASSDRDHVGVGGRGGGGGEGRLTAAEQGPQLQEEVSVNLCLESVLCLNHSLPDQKPHVHDRQGVGAFFLFLALRSTTRESCRLVCNTSLSQLWLRQLFARN